MSKGKNKNKNKTKASVQKVADEAVTENIKEEVSGKTCEANLYMDPDMDVVDSQGKALKISSSKAKKDVLPIWKKLKPFFPLSFIIAFVFDLIYGIIYYSSFAPGGL